MTTTSYADRARRFRARRAQTVGPSREVSEGSDERGADAVVGVRWDDPTLAPPPDDPWLREARAAYAPIVHLPPHGCIGPRVCARIGPCDRHVTGRPCAVDGDQA